MVAEGGALGQAEQGIFRAVRVNGRDPALVSGVHRHQHGGRLVPANFSDQNPAGTVAQRRADQRRDRDGWTGGA